MILMNTGLKKFLLQQKYFHHKNSFLFFFLNKILLEIQTAEEIRDHTIPEDLPPVAKTLSMLEYDSFFKVYLIDFFFCFLLSSSRYDIQRLAGIRSLSSVIVTDREETFRRLLPKFKVKEYFC